jgi:hypothetical protein
MTSGTLVLAPGAMTHVAVAPGAGSGLSGLAATVLIARAAVVGVEALASGLHDARHRRHRAVTDAEACWDAAGRAAVHANSEVRVLLDALRRVDVAGNPAGHPSPQPVPLAGRSLGEVLADAEKMLEQVTAVRTYIAEHRHGTARRMTDSTRDRAAAGAGLSTRPTEPRPEPAAAARRPQEPHPDVGAEVDRLLATVPGDVGPTELAGVYAAAVGARETAGSRLPELRMAVEQLRTNAARTRRHATEAAAYLEGIAAIDVDPAEPRVRRVVAGLDEVVAGLRDLSESLRDDARLLIANGEHAAANRLLADRLRKRLRADGFDVRTVDRSGQHEVIELTRPERPAHTGRVRVGRGEISYRTTGSTDHGDTDAEWGEAVAGSIGRYGRELADSGIGVQAVASGSAAEVDDDVRPGVLVPARPSHDRRDPS